MKPFLKWAGGKKQLLNTIEQYYPFNSDVTKYAEPFVGGGAVLFDILNKFDLEKIYISDVNAELINAYRVIRDHNEELIGVLSDMQKKYLMLDTENKRKYYLKQRERFNNLKFSAGQNNTIERAGLMIFLNKTCFNGLFRVNKKGYFNVPMGRYKKPMICDEENLREVSKNLQKVEIVCGDYREAAAFIDAKTLVYLDPPYRPITNTANFTAYTETFFDDAAQKELADFVDEISKKGAKILVSNSDPQNVNAQDDFFDKIYSSYQIKKVAANRMINCNSEARGKINELLINNFQL